jgi:HEAT repeat protein
MSKSIFFLLSLSFSLISGAVLSQDTEAAPDSKQLENKQLQENAKALEDALGEEESVPLDATKEELSIQKDLAHEAKLQDLLRSLSSPDERVRIEAGMELRESSRIGDTTLLSQTLKRGNNIDKQLFIIEALSKLGDKRAGEALRFETRHGELESQRAATSALGKLQTDWPIPILVRTLRQEKDEELRKRAASALGLIGSTQAVYAIRTSLSKLEDAPGANHAGTGHRRGWCGA